MYKTIGALGLAALLLGTAQAADFTQPERDPKFIQSARRQDKELAFYYGRHIPAGITFNHLGSYQAVVHRVGLDRPVTLVPVTALPYADIEALRSTARSGDVVVGALKINYGMHNPEISPGTLLLVFDGLRVHLHNVHGEDLSSFEAKLGPVPAGDKVAPVVGAINADKSSVAHIGPDSRLRLYLHLSQGTESKSLKKDGANKVLLEFTIPGLVDDDDSPALQLAKPEEPAKGKPKSKS
jgi:hypothetical protein